MKPGLTEYISFQMVFRKNWGVICCELPKYYAVNREKIKASQAAYRAAKKAKAATTGDSHD
jgi:hypothetical protein